MKLEDVSTLAPDGWWEIRRDVTLAGSDKLVIDRNTRICGSAGLYVTGSARLSVTGLAGLSVTGLALLNVADSAWLYVAGWHELARETWALLRSPDGLYYAGCQGPFTREQALAHWDREDDRACLFTLAILMCDQKEKRRVR